MNEHPQIKRLEYDSITDGIYIGTNQCCQTHFDEKLKNEGITANISLEEERVDTPFGIEFFIWIPIKNHTAPTQDQLDFGVSVLEKLVAVKNNQSGNATQLADTKNLQSRTYTFGAVQGMSEHLHLLYTAPCERSS